MLSNFKLCRHKFYNRFQMSPCIEGYGENIVYESKNCCKQNLYTFLLNNQKLSFSVNRINLNYGEEIKLTKSEKLLHSYKVLGEWKSTRGHFHLGQIYNSEQRTDAVNQKSSCLKQVSLHYGTFGSTRVEWYGWHTGLTILQSRMYYHPRNNIKWYGWHTGLTILKSRDTITLKTTEGILQANRTHNPTCQSVISPEPDSVILSSKEFMNLDFKSWVCIRGVAFVKTNTSSW